MPKALPHQEIGARFLSDRKAALLADAPRVGKTGSAILAADDILAQRILTITTASGRAVWDHGVKHWSTYDRTKAVLYEGALTAKHLDAVVEINAEERWVRAQPRREVFAIVGHEPNLGILASWLTSGSKSGDIEFRKGGAALLVFSRRPRKGEGKLRWLMGPKELATIGGK